MASEIDRNVRHQRVSVHIYPSPFTHESRILRETRSLVERGIADRVLVVALAGPGLREREEIDSQRAVWRVRLLVARWPRNAVTRAAQLLELGLRTLWKLRQLRPADVHCHSLSVLPIGVLAKLLTRARLVYDTHELETEKPRLRGVTQKLARLAERRCMRFVDRVIAVSDSIGDRYRRDHPRVPVGVVKNAPPRRPLETFRSNILRQERGIAPGDLVFLYQGLLAPGRGIEILVDVFAGLGGSRHLVLMGYGELEELAREAAGEHPTIHLQPAVPPERILEYTSGADVGLSLIENTCTSYYYCLPNKVFEYFLCGLPLIVSDFPDMGAFVDAYDCGWRVAVDRDALRDLVSRLDRDEIDRVRDRMLTRRDEVGWDHEEERLVELLGPTTYPRP